MSNDFNAKLPGVDKPEDRHQTILFSAVMPLAALLTLFKLGRKSLWLDEAFSFGIARQDWAALWEGVLQEDAIMGLYYVLLHYWLNLDQSEFVLRSLSAFFALATVPVEYAMGKCMFGKRVGIISAILLTVNTFFIRYAQEARSYSLVLLLVARNITKHNQNPFILSALRKNYIETTAQTFKKITVLLYQKESRNVFKTSKN